MADTETSTRPLPIGSAPTRKNDPLLQPLRIKGLTLRNRVVDERA